MSCLNVNSSNIRARHHFAYPDNRFTHKFIGSFFTNDNCFIIGRNLTAG